MASQDITSSAFAPDLHPSDSPGGGLDRPTARPLQGYEPTRGASSVVVQYESQGPAQAGDNAAQHPGIDVNVTRGSVAASASGQNEFQGAGTESQAVPESFGAVVSEPTEVATAWAGVAANVDAVAIPILQPYSIEDVYADVAHVNDVTISSISATDVAVFWDSVLARSTSTITSFGTGYTAFDAFPHLSASRVLPFSVMPADLSQVWRPPDVDVQASDSVM